ncbi:MAG: methyltransferase, TIGR04325 family [Bacteroidota bacterium]
MSYLLKSLIPTFLQQTYNKIRNKGVQWHGNYPTWQAAAQRCDGYDSDAIFEKVKNAALAVKAGKALYERDSVLFHEPSYSWELIANLLKIAQENDGKLCVLDFGGAFGSSYFQNKKYFESVKDLTWCVVEQAHFVDFGKKELATDQLKFYHTIKEVTQNHQPDVLLLLSVLQYLENPSDWISQFLATNISNILVDRTAFVEGAKDRITIQQIPASIYKASYPAWFFNETSFIKKFTDRYDLVAQSDSDVTKPIFLGLKKGYWQNFVFKVKQ